VGEAVGSGPWMVLAGALQRDAYCRLSSGMAVRAWSSPTTHFWVAPTVGFVVARFVLALRP